MNLASLSASYLRARPLHTALSLILLSLGVATIVLLLLVAERLHRNPYPRNARVRRRAVTLRRGPTSDGAHQCGGQRRQSRAEL